MFQKMMKYFQNLKMNQNKKKKINWVNLQKNLQKEDL